jgi:sensor histidine kinase YesM
VIEVEDNGRGLGSDFGGQLPAGHGLANVAERLRLSFGEAGRLAVEPRMLRGTRARIVIG